MERQHKDISFDFVLLCFDTVSLTIYNCFILTWRGVDSAGLPGIARPPQLRL